MTLPKTSWIIVADGAKAHVFAREGRHGDLQVVTRLGSDDARARTSEIVSDRPGRAADGAGLGHHAYEPKSDPHRHAEETFVKSLSDYIAGQPSPAPFDQLILVAPARTLGLLRRDLPKRLQEFVRHEVEKDLVNLTDDAIARHIAALDIA